MLGLSSHLLGGGAGVIDFQGKNVLAPLCLGLLFKWLCPFSLCLVGKTQGPRKFDSQFVKGCGGSL